MTEFPRQEQPPKYPAREEAEIFTYSQWGAIRNGVRLQRVTIGTPSVSNVWGVDEHNHLYRRMDEEQSTERWEGKGNGRGRRGTGGGKESGGEKRRGGGERHEECAGREECGREGRKSCFAAEPSLAAAEFSPLSPSLISPKAAQIVNSVGSVELTSFDESIPSDPWGDVSDAATVSASSPATSQPSDNRREKRAARKQWLQITALDADSGALLRFSHISAGEKGEMWALELNTGSPFRLLRASSRQKRKILLQLKETATRAGAAHEVAGRMLPEQLSSLAGERVSTVAFFQRIGASGVHLTDIACGGRDCVWAIASAKAVRQSSNAKLNSSLMSMADASNASSSWLLEYVRGTAGDVTNESSVSDTEPTLPHWRVRLVKGRVLTTISVSPEGDLWAVDSLCRAVQRVQFASDADAMADPLVEPTALKSLSSSPLFQKGDNSGRVDRSSQVRARILSNQATVTALETRLELVDDDALWQDFDVTETTILKADKEVAQVAVANQIVWCATKTGRLLLKTGSSEFREVINGGQQQVVEQVQRQKEMALNETASGFTLLQANELDVNKHRDPLFLMRNSRTKFLEQDFEELEALRVSQIAVNSDGTVRALSKATGGFTYTLRPQKLVLSTPDMFHKLWDSRGTNATVDVGVWRPFCSKVPEFRALGDYVERSLLRYPSCHSFDTPPGSKVLLAMEDVDVYYSDLDADDQGFDQALPLLMDPVRYERLWDDAGTGAAKPCTVWRPVPPPGYRALGCVVTADRGMHGQPGEHEQAKCVHESVLSSGQFFKCAGTKSHLWSTDGMRTAESGACSFHLVHPLQGVGTAAATFVATRNRAPPAAAKTAFVFSVHPDAFAPAQE
eukprot:CAMPEP_0114609422 /NCGR_PEP_ID=MMETSP0168-20121206/3081_1 /TAXON_ID=95228 ORGANISM="Vannella sp., Strain DIVA3 517/6/12" /NCGR_SAMPLE_ID=MMETSP0168 /ASSEMBLY_ACC=CAM_ASM_000044 /LENGTH=854 /DNA_ID=CAMNT_0001820341 /DNA_START=41 /DNA_END=2605 /DNA_ORIENTATION=-